MNSNWIVSGWGTTSNGSDPDSGMGGALPDALQYGTLKYVQNNETQCSNLIEGFEDTMLW